MIQLNGQKLTLKQIADVATRQERVTLAAEARERVEQSRRIVERIVAEGRTVYGVNTGFGRLSDIRIEQSELRELQLNLVRSHSCGLGKPLSETEARAMLLLRANVLACGYSGARPVLIDILVAMLERGRRADIVRIDREQLRREIRPAFREKIVVMPQPFPQRARLIVHDGAGDA